MSAININNSEVLTAILDRYQDPLLPALDFVKAETGEEDSQHPTTIEGLRKLSESIRNFYIGRSRRHLQNLTNDLTEAALEFCSRVGGNKAITCSSVTFMKAKIFDSSVRSTEGPLRICHENNTRGSKYPLLIRDIGVVHFYLLSWPTRQIFEIKLDSNAKFEFSVAANDFKPVSIDAKTVTSIKKHQLNNWHQCVVMPCDGGFKVIPIADPFDPDELHRRDSIDGTEAIPIELVLNRRGSAEGKTV